jgi:hypothetical protein
MRGTSEFDFGGSDTMIFLQGDINFGPRLRNAMFLMWILLFTPITGGCADSDRAEWREEVQMASGEVVVVSRSAIRDKSGFPASLRGVQREWKIAFPDDRIVWQSDGSMGPIALEIRGRDAFLAANIRSREYCQKFSDPSSSVLFFRWDGNTWVRIGRDEYPSNGKANLLRNPWGRDSGEDAFGLIKNKDKYLVKPYNNEVNDPLEKVMTSSWIDACSMLKKN